MNTRQAKSNRGNRVAFGVLVILISLFVLLCISGAFGIVGDIIYPVFVGFFGLADYAFCVIGIIFGLALVFNLQVKARPSKVILLFALLFMGILALHSYTSSPHFQGADYGGYLKNCYKYTNTAGGLLAGVLSYPFMKLMTPVGALVFFCALFFVTAFFAFFPFIKKNVTYTSAPKSERSGKKAFQLTQNADEKEKIIKSKSKEGTPLDKQKSPVITDFAHDADEGKKLFVIDVEGDPLQKGKRRLKGAEGYNPLYPNAAGGLEDEQRLEPKTEKYVNFSAKGLARDILFSDKPDSDSLARFSAASNPTNALKDVGASFSAVKRSEMRSKLGIDTTQTAMRENFMSKYREDGASTSDGSVKEYPRNRAEDGRNASQERLYNALSGDGGVINQSNGGLNAGNGFTQPEASRFGEARNGAFASGEFVKGELINEQSARAGARDTNSAFGTVSGNAASALDFYELKNEQLKLFKENSTAQPIFEANAYVNPTSSDAIPAEEIKKEVVKPTKIMRHGAADGNSTVNSAIEAVKGKNASRLKGMQGTVARAIEGSQPIEVESDAYDKPVSQAVYNVDLNKKPGNSGADSQQSEARIPRAFERTVLSPEDSAGFGGNGSKGFTPYQTKAPDFKNSGSSAATGNQPQYFTNPQDAYAANEALMRDKARAASKDTPPLSAFEKQHLLDNNQDVKKTGEKTGKEKSISKSEQLVKKMESIDTSKERVTQVNIDQAISQATQKRPYAAPPISLLKPADPPIMEDEDLEYKKHVLVETLAFFDVYAEVTDIMRGPTFSLYTLKVEMPKGRTIGSIVNLENDIAMKMEEESVRILAPIPGKNAVGIEVPNKHRRIVRLRELLEAPTFNLSKSPATFALGKNLYGVDYVCDIKNLPHMLIAGATGAGKSCCINSVIISLLYKASPEDVRLILIDPKRVELSVYAGIPHLLLDEIVCDVDKAIRALNWAISEMDRRTHYLSDLKYRDIDEYNQDCARLGYEKMPRIVIIVDELADLMAMGKKSVEDSINRIARLARAVGIHLILATQRPSVDVVSGTIKNNLPTRVAFKVTSGPDSRTVLDANGADKLLGNGDLLYMTPKIALPERMQGAFISNAEVKNVVEFIKENNDSVYDNTVKDAIFKDKTEEKAENDKGGAKKTTGLPPELFDALRLGLDGAPLSISNMQRRLGLGWPKAAKIYDMMDDMGLLKPDDKDPKRKKVAITEEELEQLIISNTREDDEN